MRPVIANWLALLLLSGCSQSILSPPDSKSESYAAQGSTNGVRTIYAKSRNVGADARLIVCIEPRHSTGFFRLRKATETRVGNAKEGTIEVSFPPAPLVANGMYLACRAYQETALSGEEYVQVLYFYPEFILRSYAAHRLRDTLGEMKSRRAVKGILAPMSSEPALRLLCDAALLELGRQDEVGGTRTAVGTYCDAVLRSTSESDLGVDKRHTFRTRALAHLSESVLKFMYLAPVCG